MLYNTFARVCRVPPEIYHKLKTRIHCCEVSWHVVEGGYFHPDCLGFRLATNWLLLHDCFLFNSILFLVTSLYLLLV